MDAGCANEIVLGPCDSARRTFGKSPVQFTLRCLGTQAYLLLADVDGRSIALNEMTREGDAWRLRLDLRPGTYRYRYYISDGRSTSYFLPAGADRGGRVMRMDGMDGVFDVAPPSSRLPRFSGRDGDAPRRVVTVSHDPSVARTVVTGAAQIEQRAAGVGARTEVTS